MLNPFENDPVEVSDRTRAIIALALLIGLFAIFAFTPRRDPTKLVAGLPCSILSESQISAVIGRTMELIPGDGNVCHYVSTDAASQRNVFVVALHRVVQTNSAIRRRDQALFVRHHGRTYELVVLPAEGAMESELRFASLIADSRVARSQ